MTSSCLDPRPNRIDLTGTSLENLGAYFLVGSLVKERLLPRSLKKVAKSGMYFSVIAIILVSLILLIGFRDSCNFSNVFSIFFLPGQR